MIQSYITPLTREWCWRWYVGQWADRIQSGIALDMAIMIIISIILLWVTRMFSHILKPHQHSLFSPLEVYFSDPWVGQSEPLTAVCTVMGLNPGKMTLFRCDWNSSLEITKALCKARDYSISSPLHLRTKIWLGGHHTAKIHFISHLRGNDSSPWGKSPAFPICLFFSLTFLYILLTSTTPSIQLYPAWLPRWPSG